MGSSVPLPNSPTGPVAASWLISCLLHAGLAFAAVLFVQRIQLAAQTEPFQWDVAMVAPLSTPAQSTPTAQPAAAFPSGARQPIPATKSPPPSAMPVEPVMSKPAASATTASSPEPFQEQPLHHEPTPSSPAPILSSASPPTSLPAHLSDALSEQEPFSRDHETSPVDSQTTTDSSLAPFTTTNQLQSAKVDYEWLAALMAQWIEGLDKRYPAMLRIEGAKGKVTLTAILHEDGWLSEVRIVKSSGYAALDQVAVEDVQNGRPVHLPHPLGRAQIPVKFSISYDLKTAR
jgi:periplasmic protein TonB